MSRTLVTGASGFLGQHVCADLTEAGHDVVAVGRNAAGELCNLDGGATDVFAGIGAVVHLAGALAKGPDTPVTDYLAANVALTESVMLRSAAEGANRFVFSSSRLVYGSDLGRAATEHDPAEPESAYGLSKLFAERVVAHQARRTGLTASSLRISQLVGPGDGNRGALARFAQQARSGAPITVSGEGLAVRDVIDVRDAARAVRLTLDALESGSTPNELNIGGGSTSIRGLAEIAATAANRSHGAIEHSTVDVEDMSHWALDTSLAESTIGWQPEIDLADALRHRWAVDPTLS